jgi:hypothetical protein
MILTVAAGLIIGFGLGRTMALPPALAVLAGLGLVSAAANGVAADFAPAAVSFGFVLMVMAGQVGYVFSKAGRTVAQTVRERRGNR